MQLSLLVVQQEVQPIIKSLIKKELPPLLARHFPHENDEKREITYKSENLEYKFKEKARGGGIELFVRKI